MVIDQRNAGASVNPTDGQFTLDRWTVYRTQASKLTVQQNAGSVTLPAGFPKYLGVTSSSAYSVVSSDYFLLTQPIEGFNTADLGWGTASAKTVTLSFQVYSSLTGTFGGSLQNGAANRSYPFSYSIPVANTWTTITLTIAGDTTGTWLTNNGLGINMFINLGSGSTFAGTAGAWAASDFRTNTGATNVVATSGATFYITGVQLEEGTAASPFEYRLYGTEFSLCCRYWQQFPNFGASGSGASAIPMWCPSSSEASTRISVPVSMRAAPSLGYSGTLSAAGGNGTIGVYYAGAFRTINSFGVGESTAESFRVDANCSGLSTGAAAALYLYQSTQTNVRIMLSAEL
jgi:hypothetical protein